MEHQVVTRGRKSISMPGLSFRLLQVLAYHWPATVSRRNLAREVWGEVVISDDTLRQRIRLLRQSLGGAEYVASVKGIGYRLIQPVKALEHSERDRIYYVGVLLIIVGLVAYFLWGGDTSSELYHQIRHTLRH